MIPYKIIAFSLQEEMNQVWKPKKEERKLFEVRNTFTIGQPLIIKPISASSLPIPDSYPFIFYCLPGFICF
ncbi:MAG TPA: hypothetical protein DEO71_14530 [Chryseobacterium sp.]|nr:hypothetical protein [Chryseobacterium sp.]